jgi:glycine cleavage system regulatory protein
MKTLILVKLFGQSQVDLLKNLSRQSAHLGARWLVTKVNYLEGQISALIKIELELTKVDALEKVISSAPNITYELSTLEDKSVLQSQIIQINVEAYDRPAIVNEITTLVHDFGAHIIGFESQRITSVGMDNTIFTADISLALPPEVAVEDLFAQLEAIGEHILVKQV